MDREEQKIEAFLKSRIESVQPSKSVFENVTNKLPNRNTRQKSDYKLINFVMTKGQYVGLALGVIAIVAIVSVSKSDTKLAMNRADEAPSGVESKIINDKKVATEDPSKQSANDIMASFYADADADGANANAESEEDAYMNSQVDAFNSYNQTNYENNI